MRHRHPKITLQIENAAETADGCRAHARKVDGAEDRPAATTLKTSTAEATNILSFFFAPNKKLRTLGEGGAGSALRRTAPQARATAAVTRASTSAYQASLVFDVVQRVLQLLRHLQFGNLAIRPVAQLVDAGAGAESR